MKLNEIDTAYVSEPWWYDVRGFLILTFAYRTTLWSQIKLFSSNIGDRHLEAAIGTGTLFEMILHWRRLRKQKPSQIVGFDYAPKMLAGAKHRFKGKPSIELVHADISKLPFADASFDTANIANAIHCLPDLPAAFTELRRVLRPGGTLAGNVLLYPRNHTDPKNRSFLDGIATRINAWGMRKGILHRPYAREEIQSLVEKMGFEFLSQDVRGNSYSFTARRPA